MACLEKIVPNFYSALDVFFQLWKNLIFTAFSSTRHQFNSSKIFQLRSTTRAGTMNGATPRSRVKSWTGCAEKIYNLSLFIIYLNNQAVQRGKDRRAPFLQKPGAPDLTKILELVQIDLFEEERIFCYATIVFQFMSDCASQWVVKSSWDGDGRTQVKVTVGDRVFTLDTEWNHVAESPTSSKIHEEQVGQF